MAGNVIHFHTPLAADAANLRHECGFWLLLPLPPSVNALYSNARGRGRVKSARYKAWLTEAGHTLNRAKTAVYDEPVTVHVDVRFKDKRRHDLDNLLKPLLDLIGPSGHCLIKDDAATILQAISIRTVQVWHEPAGALPKGWCRVVVKPVAKPEDRP